MSPSVWVFGQSSHCVFPLAVMIIIRLKNCWTEAGQCSGSRWPPPGSVSSSTCGPLLHLWSAQSALKPRMLYRYILLRCGQQKYYKESSHCPFTLKHNPRLHSVMKMEDYLLPFVLYASVSFFSQCYTVNTLMVTLLFFTITYAKICISWRFVVT